MTTANATLRDRLKAVRTQKDDIRDTRAEQSTTREAAKEAFANTFGESGAPDMGDVKVLESAEFKAAEAAVKALGETDDKLADLDKEELSLLGMLGEDVPTADGSGNGPRSSGVEGVVRAWNAEAVIKGDAYKGLIEAGAFDSHSKLSTVLLGKVADREQAAAFLSGAEAMSPMAATVDSTTGKLGATPADRRGIIQPNLKPLTLLDLIPVGTTDSTSIEYVQVTAIPNSAAEVAEGSTKPEETLTTVDATAPVRTIAGWIKVNKQALSDVSGLQTLIGVLLPYDVRRRIESQILAGNGTGQNLKGILNTSGLGAPLFVDGDNKADAILRAITVIYLSDGDPSFVALHPLDWQDLLLMRENNAERTGAYLYGTPAAQVAPTIWGLAITNNRAVPAGSPLVGDAMACTLLVKEGVNVLVSDSDQDDFIRNRATVLAEARVAFPVWRPASFAVAVTEEPAP